MKTHPMILAALGLSLLAQAAGAATRTSANYSLTTETTDAGGRKATSATYANDGSLGGVGGVSTAAAPARTAKHSYIGQLYDVTNVTVSASPPNVNEGATTQLSAQANLDDATRLDLDASSVGWGVVSGPITSVSAAGLATAGIVYQNTAATVSGRYAGRLGTLGLTVLDINPDNFGTYAGDGLPDDWQVSYFGLNNPNAAPGRDPDGDGQTNAFEYVVNTVPTDSTSLFRLRIENVAGQPTHKNLLFSPRYPSRTYSVVYRTNVATGLFNPLIGTSTSDAGTERTVTDLNATNSPRFYRVRITVP